MFTDKGCTFRNPIHYLLVKNTNGQTELMQKEEFQAIVKEFQVSSVKTYIALGVKDSARGNQ